MIQCDADGNSCRRIVLSVFNLSSQDVESELRPISYDVGVIHYGYGQWLSIINYCQNFNHFATQNSLIIIIKTQFKCFATDSSSFSLLFNYYELCDCEQVHSSSLPQFYWTANSKQQILGPIAPTALPIKIYELSIFACLWFTIKLLISRWAICDVIFFYRLWWVCDGHRATHPSNLILITLIYSDGMTKAPLRVMLLCWLHSNKNSRRRCMVERQAEYRVLTTLELHSPTMCSTGWLLMTMYSVVAMVLKEVWIV